MRKVPFPYYLGEETEMNVLRRGYPGDFDEIRAIAIYSLADGRLRLLSLPDSNYRLFNRFEWSPDGTRLLIDQSSEDGTDRWLYVATPTEGSVREVWHDRRDTRIYPSFTSAWRSDGKAILFLGDQDEWDRLYVVPAEGGGAQPITRGDGDVLDMIVSADTKTILFASNQASPYERHVYRLPESGGEPQRITKLPGTHQPTLSPDGKTLALLHSNDTTPTELYLLDLESPTAESRVTYSPPKPFDDIPWIQPKYVTFKSRIDDYTLHGRLVVPPDLEPGKKYPVILGPHVLEHRPQPVGRLAIDASAISRARRRIHRFPGRCEGKPRLWACFSGSLSQEHRQRRHRRFTERRRVSRNTRVRRSRTESASGAAATGAR